MLIAGGTSDQQILGVLETRIVAVDTVHEDAKPTVLFNSEKLQIVSGAALVVSAAEVALIAATDDGEVHTVVHRT
jgi:hypothetical protein